MSFNKLKNSLKHAIEGILEALTREHSFRLQLFIGGLVILVAFLSDLVLWKWAVLFLVIGVILSLELINTACEKIIDILVKEHHPHIKYIKDILAGAVLIFSVVAIIIAIIIFIL